MFPLSVQYLFKPISAAVCQSLSSEVFGIPITYNTCSFSVVNAVNKSVFISRYI